MGCEEDMGYYRPGLAEFQSPLVALPDVLDADLVRAFTSSVRHYVNSPHERAAIADTGRRLFQARRMSGL